MTESALFSTLIAQEYSVSSPSLHPLVLNRDQGYAHYRVDLVNGQSWFLRAYRQDSPLPTWQRGLSASAWLKGQATILLWLEQQNYPAPHLVRTRAGDLVSSSNEWWVLVTTFIRGSRLRPTLDNQRQLARVVSRLHALPMPGAEESAPAVMNAWWHPVDRAIAQSLARLATIADSVPPPWRELHDRFGSILNSVRHALALPVTLTHGDCWLGTTVNRGDEVVLVDWECAGIGTAVLDMGCLLSDCYLGATPSQPARADESRVNATVDGYVQERSLTPAETNGLLEAIQFGIAFRGAFSLSRIQHERWSTRLQRDLVREQARLEASQQIAALAQARLQGDG